MTRAAALASRPAPDHKDDLPNGDEFDSIEKDLEAAEHVPFQLPNKFTRVGFLLAGITSSDT
eukprot:5429447-Ditylum_brightwellii.AAC.1